MTEHIISEEKCLKDALEQLNALSCKPLVLFVIDKEHRVLGSITDGDSRRALINNASLNDNVQTIMHRDFCYILQGQNDNVIRLKQFKSLKIKLVPIIDDKKRIIDIIDLTYFKTQLPVDAVLMAGGKGVRLRPLTEKTPKPLLPVGDKAIIDHNIDRLISYGIKHISVTVNYLKEQIEEHFQTPRVGIQIQTVREPQFLGTIGSVKFVKEFYNDTILVMNSDLFSNIDYEDFYLHFKKHEADMSVAAVPYSISVPYGIFDLEGRNIKGLIEKPKYNYYANAGIYLFKKTILSEIPEDKFFNATDLIEKLIEQKKNVIRYPLNGTWIDIGNPQEYQKAKDLVAHITE